VPVEFGDAKYYFQVMDDVQKQPDPTRRREWLKRLGFWGFMFFLVKGLLWLIVPALVAYWSLV
jgi:hypothetical protein